MRRSLKHRLVVGTKNKTGLLTFTVSPDHATVTNYTLRLRAQTSTAVLTSLGVGKPTPNASSICTLDLQGWLSTLSSGNYSVSVAASDAGGTTDSTLSNAFTISLRPE